MSNTADPVKPYNAADSGPKPNVDLKDVISVLIYSSRRIN